MVKKAVLFDLDDTLYDYTKAHKLAIKEVHKEFNKKIKISFKKFINLFELSKKEIKRELAGTASSHNRVLYFQRLIEKAHKTENPRLVLKLYKTYWDTLLKNMQLKKDAIKVFKELRKRKLKIAIVSNLTTHIQLRKLKKLHIGKYIDSLVTSEEAGTEKPNPLIFLEALNKLGIMANEAIMVGDDPISDIEGANAVKLDSVLLTNKKKKYIPANDYRKPKYQIKNLKQLINIINKTCEQ